LYKKDGKKAILEQVSEDSGGAETQRKALVKKPDTSISWSFFRNTDSSLNFVFHVVLSVSAPLREK